MSTDYSYEQILEKLDAVALRTVPNAKVTKDEAVEIIRRFGQSLTAVCESKMFFLSFPKSYLLDPYDKIEEAFGILYSVSKDDPSQFHDIYVGFYFFNYFVDDKKAILENAKVFKKLATDPGFPDSFKLKPINPKTLTDRL